jgi:hypothetical protein
MAERKLMLQWGQGDPTTGPCWWWLDPADDMPAWEPLKKAPKGGRRASTDDLLLALFYSDVIGMTEGVKLILANLPQAVRVEPERTCCKCGERAWWFGESAYCKPHAIRRSEPHLLVVDPDRLVQIIGPARAAELLTAPRAVGVCTRRDALHDDYEADSLDLGDPRR